MVLQYMLFFQLPLRIWMHVCTGAIYVLLLQYTQYNVQVHVQYCIVQYSIVQYSTITLCTCLCFSSPWSCSVSATEYREDLAGLTHQQMDDLLMTTTLDPCVVMVDIARGRLTEDFVVPGPSGKNRNTRDLSEATCTCTCTCTCTTSVQPCTVHVHVQSQVFFQVLKCVHCACYTFSNLND